MFSLPFMDLRELKAADLPREIMAAGVVGFLTIPQAVAYAVVAGLPPAAGLYAAALPAVVGSFFRSSRHVVSGPSNALSLLVGASIASLSGVDPVRAAATLALMVGVMQVTAGLLRLGALVDYISRPVVLGYITGAGVLIGVGQLHNITGTPSSRGHLLATLSAWASSLGQAQALPAAVALGTVALVLGLRRVDRRIPGALVAMVVSILLNVVFGLEERGLVAVETLAPVPRGLPPIAMPSLEGMSALLPAAIAATVLSLVESTAVARSIASRTGQRLDASAEFFGQGTANLAAAISGGYPVSGSLSRSALNEAAGARSRLAGALGGAFILVVLVVLAPVVDRTPIACLAGLLLIIAWGLVDVERIRETFRARRSDGLAFTATMLGTWIFSLDKAIYLGVAISLIIFLRRARLLVIRDLAMDEEGRLREVDTENPSGSFSRCELIRVLHVEGSLFFGAAGELRDALDEAGRAEGLKVLIVRLKRTRGLDVTTAEALSSVAEALRARGRRMMLVGMRPEAMRVLVGSGAAAIIGEENLFPTEATWFAAMRRAIASGLEALSAEERERCPLSRY